MNGELVKKLVDSRQKAVNYIIEFDGGELSSGIYFFKVSTKDFVEVKKMSLIK